MSFKAIVYAYILGGITFIPLVVIGVLFYTFYTSVPIGDIDPRKFAKARLQQRNAQDEDDDIHDDGTQAEEKSPPEVVTGEVDDLPKPRKGWLTVRRTFEEAATDGSYVGLVRGFLDARSKDPKRSRPKDTWYVVLKGKVMYLYEDEAMTECEAAIELSGHDVVIYPEGLADGELFAKRNAICLKPKGTGQDKEMPSVTKEMAYGLEQEEKVGDALADPKQKRRSTEKLVVAEQRREEVRKEALDPSTPWFIFVRSNVEMEDWYLSLVHASDHPAHAPTLAPLEPVFLPSHMLHLVTTLDEQPDVIPMRWLNALIGRVFYSFYRTQQLESFIIGRLMKKLSKIKRPAILTHIVVREVSVGDKAPTLSKPMLKELTKEGDASLEVHLRYKGEIRITVEAVATINLGARFKPYAVKLVLAAVLREMEGNLLIKVKRPPSNRLWYAFTTMPRMVLDVEPVVSDRQITWGMILSTIESKMKEVIQESVVLPNMDDIAFFDSINNSHRGGIWGDASRKEKPSTLFPEPPSVSVDDDQSTASEPAPEISAPLPTNPEFPPVQRSHTVDVQQPDGNTSVGPPDVVPVSRPATTTGTSSSQLNGALKRRSWLGGGRADGSELPLSDSPPEFFDERVGGRRSSTPGSIVGRSSSSKSSRDDSTSSGVPDTSSVEPDNNLLTPIPIRQNPSSRRSFSSSSQHDTSQSTPEKTSTSAPSESPMDSYRERTTSTTSPQKNGVISPTFFQTLKSRDKQAISNTAKETMRKWAANWSALRDKSGNNSSNDEAADGESHQAPAPEQRAHKPRPSYAEVRAAVEQRKGKGRDHHEEQEWDTRSSEAEGYRQWDEQASLNTFGRSNDRGLSPEPTLNVPAPTRPESDGSSSNPSSRPSTPPLLPPRSRTSSRRSVPPAEATPPSHSLPEEIEHPTVPIHTQPPRPKTMTIPGIHASHRGEVMSMGYAPPPAPAPVEQKKTPAIQSVYRLWKNPAANNENGQAGQAQVDAHDEESNTPSASAPSTSTALTDSPTPPTRPIPPPLPPRSNATHVMQVKSDSSTNPIALEKTPSLASAALQSIVTKDNSKRASLERPAFPTNNSSRDGLVEKDVGTDDVIANPSPQPVISPKPPLPPRRMTAASQNSS